MLVRLLLSAAIMTVPFGILAILSGRAEGLIWLMLPFIGLIPVFFLAAILVFIPSEKLAVAAGWPPLAVLIIAGSIVGSGIAFAAAYFGNKKATILREIAGGDLKVIGAIAGVVLLGAAMGGVWHYSRRVAEHLGWA